MKKPSLDIGAVDHLPSRVASHLAREIRAGRLKSGEKLPGENQLADRYGVSRNVIREATAQLRADGVLHARHGVGAFILPPEASTVIRLDREALQSGHGLAQLFELRSILETEAAALAALRITEDDLCVLRQAIDRMTGDERQTEGSIDADIAFHSQIAKATGNEYISTFITYIAQQIRQSIHLARRTGSPETVIAPTVAEHIAVYDALAAKDPAKARAAMQAHIAGAATRVAAPFDSPDKPKD